MTATTRAGSLKGAPALAAAFAAALFAAAPCRGGEAGTDEPLDFAAQAEGLYHAAACARGGTFPARFDADKVAAHCEKMDALVKDFRAGWLAEARAYIARLRPKALPATVVYPFGGGDLVSALATFPDAEEYNLISIEPAGDPRPYDSIDMAALEASLGVLEKNIRNQFRVGHSRTDAMQAAAWDVLPAQLLFALVALRAHGREPAGLRYFRVNPDGSLAYLTARDLADKKAAKSAFRNMELSFRVAGSTAARTAVLRHFDVDLSDGYLKKNPGLLRHLEAKGPVAAMTKAASYLLWERGFSRIRDYLLKNMAWMISDSTGIPPAQAKAAGFVQDAYGRFEGPFLKAPSRPAADFVALWKSQPHRRLPFEYGYPDVHRNLNLLVTRRPVSPSTPPPKSGSPKP